MLSPTPNLDQVSDFGEPVDEPIEGTPALTPVAFTEPVHGHALDDMESDDGLMLDKR